MKNFVQRFGPKSPKEMKPPRPISVLINELDTDASHDRLTDAQRDDCLEELKLYTRTAEEAAPLCTKQGVLLLCRHGFDHGTAKTSRTALKCLANVMLLASQTRQIFVDLGYPARATDLYKHDNREDEFLAARILFLLTYGTSFDFKTVLEDKQLVGSINANIVRHSKFFQTANQRKRQASVGDAASPVAIPSDQKALELLHQTTSMALGETLKFLFNLCTFYPDTIRLALSPSVLPILKILQRLKLQEHPLQPPVTYLINALLALDLEERRSDLFPTFDTKCNVDRLLQILDLTVIRCHPAEVERSTNPLVTLLRKLYEIGPKGIRLHLQSRVLPSEKDREKVLGKSDSLSSRLLSLSSSGPAAPTVSKSLQEFFFELSGKDAGAFVRNIGYGFAAGFLMSHNLTVPQNVMNPTGTAYTPTTTSSRVEELDDDADTDDDANRNVEDGAENGSVGKQTVKSSADASIHSDPAHGGVINPITGQRRDMEESDEEDTRSEDEKIREAERLFTLFERLKATGVVDIENPVIKAAQEGRL